MSTCTIITILKSNEPGRLLDAFAADGKPITWPVAIAAWGDQRVTWDLRAELAMSDICGSSRDVLFGGNPAE